MLFDRLLSPAACKRLILSFVGSSFIFSFAFFDYGFETVAVLFIFTQTAEY